jgi:hypothetical protein
MPGLTEFPHEFQVRGSAQMLVHEVSVCICRMPDGTFSLSLKLPESWKSVSTKLMFAIHNS